MQNFLSSLFSSNNSSDSVASAFDSFSNKYGKKKPVASPVSSTSVGAVGTKGGYDTAPGIPASTVGATSTQSIPQPKVADSPAKKAFVESLSSQGGIPQPITGNATTPSGAVVNSGTGETISTPTPDKNNSYRAAFDDYIASLKPSTEEAQASKYLSDLTLQSKKDYEKALESGDTLGFASGEAARVNRNNAFGIEAASSAVDALTGNRNATTEAQKARLDFEKSLLNDESDADKTKFDQDLDTKKFEEDKRQYGLDYALKQQEVAINQQKANQDATTVKDPNVEQSKARQFATAAANGNTVINDINYSQGLLPDSSLFPNFLKSTNRQKFEQASRAVVNAILRRESGATVTDDEFNNKYKELIPAYGDSQGVKDQKKLAREAAIKSITEAGGSGFSPNLSSTDSQPQQMKLPNGTVVTLQEDGTYQ